MIKDYMNYEERNQMMVMGGLIRMEEFVKNKGKDGPKMLTMADSWEQRGAATKDEIKWLKTSHTFLRKFFDSVIKRMNKDEQEKLKRKLSKFDFRYVDDYTLDKVYRDLTDKMKYAVMENDDFQNWTVEVMEVKCKGCTCDWKECTFHKALEDNFVPETEWNLPNCRYAYNEVSEEESKEIAEKYGFDKEVEK